MSRAAIRYAKAILEISHSNGNAVKVNEDMLSIVASIAGSAELIDFLSIVNQTKKYHALLIILWKIITYLLAFLLNTSC